LIVSFNFGASTAIGNNLETATRTQDPLRVSLKELAPGSYGT